MEFLSFRLGGEEYAIDILRVREIRAHAPVTRIANMPAYVKGVLNLRGAIVPVLDMRIKMGFEKAEYDAFTVVIILDIGGLPAGIVVDAVSDVIALADNQIKPAASIHGGLDAAYVRGVAPLDGRMLVVLDIARVMEDVGVSSIMEDA